MRWPIWLVIEGLRFRFGFELNVTVGDFDRVFNGFALVLLADLLGLLLHERGE
jgi:hypothetical protein